MTTMHDVINPATEEVVTSVEQADEAATDAQSSAQRERCRGGVPAIAPMLRHCCTVDAHLEELAQLEVANAGHTSATRAGRPATSETSQLLLCTQKGSSGDC